MNVLQAYLGAAVLLLPASLLAQSTAARTPSPDDDATIKLSEFTVSASSDRGYQAGNAISATKTNTPLRDLPVNLSVVTNELLKDLNVQNPLEALSYSASVNDQLASNNPEIQGPAIHFVGTTFVRGSGTFFNLRNGFRAYETPFAANTERIEIVKGPASVLYGITKPGGVVNFITAKPRMNRNTGSASFSYGSYGTTRSSIDLNYGKIMQGKVAARVIASYTDAANQFHHSDSWERGIAPSLTIVPFASTRVDVEFESSTRERPTNSRPPTRPIPGHPGAQVPMFVYPRGAGDPVALLPQLPPGFTSEFSHRGAAEVQTVRASKPSISVTQLFGEHLSVNAQYEYQRRTNNLVGFVSSVQFTGTAAEAAIFPFPRIRRQYQFHDQRNDLDNTSITAIYKFDATLPVVGASDHKLIAGASRMVDKYKIYRAHEFRPGTNTRVDYFVPLSPTANSSGPTNFPQGETRFSVSANDLARERNAFDLGFISYQGTFLQNRVILNGGVTRTVFEQKRWFQRVSAGTIGQGYFDTTATANSPLVGGIVRPLPWLGLFGQASKSFNPNTGRRDGFDNPLPPERGKGTEFGFKFDPWQGRISGTVSFYEIVEQGRIVNDPNAPTKDSFYIDATGRHLISGPNDPRFDPSLAGQVRGASVAVGEAVSEGAEVDLVYTHDDSLQGTLSYAYMDTYARRDLNTSQANYTGRPLPNTVNHKVAGLVKYKFTQGTLRGVDVVVGLNWRDRFFRNTINQDGTTTGIRNPVPRWAKPQWNGDVKLGYATKIFGRSVDFALNVRNVFEADQWVGAVPKAAGELATEPYYYSTPRLYTFRTSVRF